MTRTFGLVMLLVSLAIGGVLFAQQARNDGPASPAATAAETQAMQESAGVNFQAADQAMQAALAENGTYVGAVLPPGSGVVIVSAQQTSYCLQAGAGTAVQHEVGPGGAAQPGPC